MTALTVVNALLLTMADGQDPFHGWLTVGEDGRITGIGPGRPPAAGENGLGDMGGMGGNGPGKEAGEVLDARGRIVAPGFVSAHSHLHTSGMRGIAADEQLYPWVRACVRLTMGADPDDMYWFVLHGCLDFLANGITSAFNFPQNEVLSLYDPATGSGGIVRKDEAFLTRQFDAIADSGLRVMGAIRLDDEPGGQGPSDARVHDRFDRLASAQADRIPAARHLGAAVYGAVQWSSDPRTARLEAEVMARHGIVNQAHFLETSQDLDGQRRKFAWYAAAGTLGETMIFGHFVHPTDEIVAAVAGTGSRVCWQPTSNGRLGSGVADIVRYRRAGIGVGVGLDDQSCTDVCDPFANMRLGMYAQRARYTDPSVLSAREMLRLHTLGSAEVLGIADRVGSLAPGRYADFLVVDPTRPDTGPMWDPYATYVLACGLRNLDEVRVGGRLVSEGGASASPLAGQSRAELHSRVIAAAKRAGLDAPASPLLSALDSGTVPRSRGGRTAAPRRRATPKATPEPAPGPAPLDPSVWRVAGVPLAPPLGSGPLDGLGVAVKDLFAVEGHPTGGGVPAYLAGQPPQADSAPVVTALRRAGAHLAGIAQTDEFAYSIAGSNAHYGAAPNPAAPGRLGGGSSSGPAAAVALGQAQVGLGTDTAGSIRVPAAYQGLVGFRPTHGAVPAAGVLPLAPSFDTVGWLTRDVATSAAVAATLLAKDGAFPLAQSPLAQSPLAQSPAGAPVRAARLPVAERLAEGRTRELFAARVAAIEAAGLLPLAEPVGLTEEMLDEWFAAFRTVQAYEAWQCHGGWIEAHPGRLGADVAARFAAAAQVTAGAARAARATVARARERLRYWLDGTILLLPTVPGPAPPRAASPAEIDDARARTLRISCLAPVAGAPAISLPLAGHDAPTGFCLVGAPGTDLALLSTAALLAAVAPEMTP